MCFWAYWRSSTLKLPQEHLLVNHSDSFRRAARRITLVPSAETWESVPCRTQLLPTRFRWIPNWSKWITNRELPITTMSYKQIWHTVMITTTGGSWQPAHQKIAMNHCVAGGMFVCSGLSSKQIIIPHAATTETSFWIKATHKNSFGWRSCSF